jgi:hypothetical protein
MEKYNSHQCRFRYQQILAMRQSDERKSCGMSHQQTEMPPLPDLVEISDVSPYITDDMLQLPMDSPWIHHSRPLEPELSEDQIRFNALTNKLASEEFPEFPDLTRFHAHTEPKPSEILVDPNLYSFC